MTELPESNQFGDYGEWPGRAVVDQNGDRIGQVREIYLDDATDRPEWVLTDRGEADPRFIPLAGATVENESIRVATTSDTIEAAPSLEPSKQLTQDEERDLYRHYGVPLDEEASDTVLPATDESAATSDAEPTTPASAEEAATGPTVVPDPVPAATGPTTMGPTSPTETPSADGPTVEDPDPQAELPPPGTTSEPEDTGPMVPPRPEPVAPPRPEPEPEPSGRLAAVKDKPVPAAAALLAAIAALLLILARRRS